MKDKRTLTHQEQVKALRLFNIGGIIGAIPFSLWSGVFITGFALHLGAKDIEIGLLGTIPIVAGIAQPLASYWAERSRLSRKLITNIFYAICVLFWIPIILIPVFFRNPSYSLFLFFSSYTLSNIFITMTNPPYVSWLGDIVPEDIRGRYFSRRNMWAGLAGMSVSLIMGRFVDILPKEIGFPIVFSLGAAFAIVEIVIIFLQPEPYREPRKEMKLLDELVTPFRNKDFKLYTFFIALWNFSVIMPGQFFSVFMLEYLKLSYTTIVLVGTSSGIAGLLAQPLFGYIADRYANKSILLLTSLLASFIPFFYVFMNPRFPTFSLILLYAVNIIAGAIWAGITLTQFNLLLLLSPPEHRMSYVGTHSAFISLTGAGSPFIGGLIANALKDLRLPVLGLDLTNIKILFIISTTLRLLSLPLLHLVKEGKEEESPLELVREIVPKKPLKTIRALRGLFSNSENEKIKSIRTLAASPSPLAMDSLLKLLNDPNPEVREETIIALGKIGDKAAIEALLKHLAIEKRQSVNINETLRKLGYEKDIDKRIAEAFQFVLPELEKKSSEELIQLLEKTQDEEILSLVAFIIAKKGYKEAIIKLLEIRDRISSSLYKRQWVYALGRLLDLDIYPFLSLDSLELYQKMEALLRSISARDDRLRKGIKLAIRYFGEGDYKRFIQRLLKMLSYENLPQTYKMVLDTFSKIEKPTAEEAVLVTLYLNKMAKER